MNWKRYGDIILYRTYAEVKSEAQINYMGYAWWILEPLVNTVLFYAILVLVMQQSTVGALSFLLVGTITWQWFSGAVVTSANTIFDAGQMLKFIYLPKIILPLISVLASTWRFGFLLLLLLAWCVFSGQPLTVAYLALPVLLGLQLVLILGVALPVAALIPYFPDARYAVDVLLRSLMLISCIFFSIDQVPLQYHEWVYVNPMAVLIEAYRTVLLHGAWPDWGRLAYAAAVGLVSIGVSVGIYRRIDLSVVKSIHR
jgi:lipopolysaccharide transport system permease protein